MKYLAHVVLILSALLLIACLLGEPKPSRLYTMIAASILFSGSQIALAICSDRDETHK